MASLLCVTGCATVQSTDRTQRGDLLRSTPQPPQVEYGEQALHVSSDGIASLTRKATTCVTSVNEYRTMRVQTHSGGLSSAAVGNFLLIGGGGGAMALSTTTDDEILNPVLLGGGAGLALAGLIGLAVDDFENPPTDELVPTQDVEKDLSRQCNDGAQGVSGAVPWHVTLISRYERSGTTDANGTVDLKPVVVSIVQNTQWDDAGLRALFSSSSLPLAVTLGTAPTQNLSVKAAAIPDSVFEPMARAYEAGLSGDAQARWGNCKILAHSNRETFECFFSQ